MSQDLDKTLWVGNLPDNAKEDILYELFLQAGPLSRVSIAKEKDGRQKSFAFVTFEHDVSVPYTIELMNGMQLYGRNLRLQSRPGSKHQQQQQQQQQGGQVPYQNTGNPYGNGQQQAPYNPYGQNRPDRSQQPQGQQQQSPQLNRSNTWHGDDLDQLSRDRLGREGRDNDRYSSSNRDRDRSGSRRREDYDRGGYGGRDDYRQNSNNSGGYKGGSSYGSEDFESKRKNVLQKQEQMLNRYRQTEGKHQSWQQKPYNNRRGRY